jgi:hypothetical protein
MHPTTNDNDGTTPTSHPGNFDDTIRRIHSPTMSSAIVTLSSAPSMLTPPSSTWRCSFYTQLDGCGQQLHRHHEGSAVLDTATNDKCDGDWNGRILPMHDFFGSCCSWQQLQVWLRIATFTALGNVVENAIAVTFLRREELWCEERARKRSASKCKFSEKDDEKTFVDSVASNTISLVWLELNLLSHLLLMCDLPGCVLQFYGCYVFPFALVVRKSWCTWTDSEGWIYLTIMLLF